MRQERLQPERASNQTPAATRRFVNPYPLSVVMAAAVVGFCALVFSAFFAWQLSDSLLLGLGFGIVCMLASVALRVELLARRVDDISDLKGYAGLRKVRTVLLHAVGFAALLSALAATAAHLHYGRVITDAKDIVDRKRQDRLQAIAAPLLRKLDETPSNQPPSMEITPPPKPALFKEALIIGNSSYRFPDIPSLRNARTDAQKVSHALKKLGYRTILIQEGSLAEINSAIAEWQQNLNPATHGLLYFAGHAFGSDTGYKILPVDYSPQEAHSVISLSDVLHQVAQKRPASSIVIVDACRTPSPLIPGSNNQSSIEIGEPNTYIAMASEPGKEAFDGTPGTGGLFTRALLESIQLDLDVDELFRNVRNRTMHKAATLGVKQVPWSSNNLTGPLKLRGSVSTPGSVDGLAVSGTSATNPNDAWNPVRSNGRSGSEESIYRQLNQIALANGLPTSDTAIFVESIVLLMSGKSGYTKQTAIHFFTMLLLLLADIPMLYCWTLRSELALWCARERRNLRRLWLHDPNRLMESSNDVSMSYESLPELTLEDLNTYLGIYTPRYMRKRRALLFSLLPADMPDEHKATHIRSVETLSQNLADMGYETRWIRDSISLFAKELDDLAKVQWDQRGFDFIFASGLGSAEAVGESDDDGISFDSIRKRFTNDIYTLFVADTAAWTKNHRQPDAPLLHEQRHWSHRSLTVVAGDRPYRYGWDKRNWIPVGLLPAWIAERLALDNMTWQSLMEELCDFPVNHPMRLRRDLHIDPMHCEEVNQPESPTQTRTNAVYA